MPTITLQSINLGNYANDGTGDDLRTAFAKVINNFNALKDAIPSSLAEDANPTLGGNLNLNGKSLFSNNDVNLNIPSNKKFKITGAVEANSFIGQISDITNHSLDDLSDVVITSPTSGQSLVYDGDKWVPGAVSATFTTVDGGSASTIYIIETGSVIDGGYA